MVSNGSIVLTTINSQYTCPPKPLAQSEQLLLMVTAQAPDVSIDSSSTVKLVQSGRFCPRLVNENDSAITIIIADFILLVSEIIVLTPHFLLLKWFKIQIQIRKTKFSLI